MNYICNEINLFNQIKEGGFLSGILIYQMLKESIDIIQLSLFNLYVTIQSDHINLFQYKFHVL